MMSRWGTKKPERIVVSADGFDVLRDSDLLGRVRFDDILSVEAYKRDELTTDLVCFDITTVGELPVTWFVHEEVPGWLELVKALQHLSGFDTTWPGKIIQPAFAESRTVIYDRFAKGKA